MKCQECDKKVKNFKALATHIQFNHDKKKYYNDYMKKEGEGLCKTCGNPTKFTILGRGYEKFCCKECERIDYSKRMARDNPMKTVAAKQNQRNTNLKRYGVSQNTKRPEIKEQIKQTCLKKYGVENVIQDSKIFRKAQITGKLLHRFNEKIEYRGSYELDFLENFYNKINIIQGLSFKYNYLNKKHIYHSDFFIPSLNLIVEIKNSYYYKRFKSIILTKKQATIDAGYNYIMIVDKDYTEFLGVTQIVL